MPGLPVGRRPFPWFPLAVSIGLAVWGAWLLALVAESRADRLALAVLAAAAALAALGVSGVIRTKAPRIVAVTVPGLVIACLVRLSAAPANALAAYYTVAAIWWGWLTFALVVLGVLFWLLLQVRG